LNPSAWASAVVKRSSARIACATSAFRASKSTGIGTIGLRTARRNLYSARPPADPPAQALQVLLAGAAARRFRAVTPGLSTPTALVVTTTSPV
jgi:hypothetical protein